MKTSDLELSNCYDTLSTKNTISFSDTKILDNVYVLLKQQLSDESKGRLWLNPILSPNSIYHQASNQVYYQYDLLARQRYVKLLLSYTSNRKPFYNQLDMPAMPYQFNQERPLSLSRHKSS